MRQTPTCSNPSAGDRTQLLLKDGAFYVSRGRCCAIILMLSLRRFLMRFTENASRLWQKSLISPAGRS